MFNNLFSDFWSENAQVEREFSIWRIEGRILLKIPDRIFFALDDCIKIFIS